MVNSLWGEEFTIKETPKQTKKIVDKINKPKQVKVITEKSLKSKSLSTRDKLNFIYSEVDRILGKYKENTIVIRDKETLIDYFDCAIKNGEIAIDTETNNSLDPLTCLLMGPCIYTPGKKNAYIPMHHVDFDGKLLDNQLTEKDFREQLDRLNDTKIIMHNGKFDYQVIKCTCGGIELPIYWDTMIAAKILDENEKRAGLKYQYIDKIDSSQEKYDIEHLFEGIEYSLVDPDIFALYAATDAFMTYKLYKWQQEQFKKSQNDGLFNVFMNVEMPVIQVAAEMELTGICIDKEYADRLSHKTHLMADKIDEKISKELLKYRDVISEWRKTEEANYHPISKVRNKSGDFNIQKSKNEQLFDPPQVTSPTQLAILLYDVLKVKQVSTKSPRGTGEDILNKIDLPICKLILEKRGIEKLLNTYIDKLPECVNEKDGRLHAHFNQVGAGTGRFSSSDPNLQNIPSHEKNIRLMFTAGEGKVLVGADFSQQEPRLLSQYSQDTNMINAYKEGKDLYATIASGVYKNGYWDNMEHHEDGSPNPEGKKRRSNCKSLLLGIMYGRGPASIAEQIGASLEEAQGIIDNFYKSFPAVKQWTEQTEKDAKKNGYVVDLWGRRRRLPDIQLPKYSVKYRGSNIDFNPLFGSEGKLSNSSLLSKYQIKLKNVRSRKEYEKIKNEAFNEGVDITDNGGFISQAERQCVNARIQGGAASMSKIAMRKVFDNQELKKLEFKLLLQVHDELIGECPKENAEQCMNILTDVMKHSVEPLVQVPFKCDGYIVPRWYDDDFGDIIREKYKSLIDKDIHIHDAFNLLLSEHSELSREQLLEYINS